MKYSGFKVLWEGLSGNKGWKPLWRKPDPKKSYDIIIVGGGGHGLATAYYLSNKFNITNIAVIVYFSYFAIWFDLPYSHYYSLLLSVSCILLYCLTCIIITTILCYGQFLVFYYIV